MTGNEFLELVNSGGGWIAIFYVFFIHIIPKIAPTYAKSLNKNQNREDRLFDILSATNHQNAKLTSALEDLSNACREHNYRLERLEDLYQEKHRE